MIRCPSCGAGQLATRTTCSKCQGSLTEIVAGYKDRLALALDREQLEADGWKLIDVKEDAEGAPFSARFRRTAEAGPRPPRERRADQRDAGGARAWLMTGVVLVALAAILVAALKLRSDKSSGSEAADTEKIASLGVEGAPGLLFSGTISAGTATRDIKGGVPQSFDLEAKGAYTVVVQKAGTDLALLRVTVTCANGTTFSTSTTAPSGVLALSAHCE